MTAPLHLLFALVFAVPATTFGVIGDTQGNPGVFRRAVAQMRRNRVEFAIHLGDLAQCASRRKWRQAKRIMRLIGPPWRPWYVTPGNHDVTNCRTRRYERRLRRFWGKWWGRTGHGPHYCDWAFFNFDSSVGEPINEIADLVWMVKNAWLRWIVVFSHRPPGPRLRRVLKAHNRTIRAVFHGHEHRYSHQVVNGVDVYCSGGGGGRLDRGGYYHWLKVTLTWRVSVEVMKL